jgi:hypothetical protein
MSGVQVSCPGCGAAVSFPVGSAIVAVCPYCRSVVARGDQRVEDLGKVAALVETDSALAVGLKGRYRDAPFELTGRAQLAHPAGGVWDEWYAAFADGRWGWLAEAQGRFYLTFEQTASPDKLPPFDDLKLGGRLHVPQGPSLIVAEKSHARTVSAEGAIPYRLVPGVTYYYADLSGPSGEFATLDYGESPPQLYLGREVHLADLGLPARAQPREARQVAGVHLNCPQCGGALELRAPDKSERVVCPNCAALLDVNQGQLRYLKVLEQGAVRPLIPLGTVGRLNGQSFLVIGFLQRSVRLKGVRYPWDEYLLYDLEVGFRWLVCSDQHWNFVEPLPPGAVRISGRNAVWTGKEFKIFQRAQAGVDKVLGEFYWKVEAGEQVDDTDYIRPPQMLSREVTRAEGEGEGEINWSLGTYLPAAEVQKAFGLNDVPQPHFPNVAPNQPFLHKRLYLDWLILLGVAVLLLIVVDAISPQRTVFEKTFSVEPTTDPEKPQVIFTEPFQLQGRHNILVTVRSDVDNSWLDVEGDLIQEEGDQFQPFSAEVSYYHGVEGGEAWQEGSRETTVYLSAQPSGKYLLRLELVTEHSGTKVPAQPVGPPGQPTTPPPSPPRSVTVRVEQGAPRLMPWALAVLALSVIPLIVGLYHFAFERNRWEDSAFSPYHTQPVKE